MLLNISSYALKKHRHYRIDRLLYGYQSRKETMEKLLTLKEVCELLGSEDPKGRKVRELWKRGELEGAKFGRKLMFKQSSVEDYIDAQFRLQR